MSKVTGPLLSFSASGAIAKAQVYATWRGINYARRYVIPSNPQTAEQTLTRSAFAFLQNIWKYAPADMSEAFDAYATGLPLTGRNALVKFNLATLRTAADLSTLIFSPGARSGLAAAAMALTPGSNQITVDLTAPTLPAGWSINRANAIAILDQDPNTGTDYVMTSATDDTAPWSIVLTGLTPSVQYVVGGWFRFTRPDGRNAYGLSLNDAATPTV